MRGHLVILVAAVGIACEQAATPTAPSPSIVQTSGFFTNGPVQLSCRLTSLDNFRNWLRLGLGARERE